MPDAKGRKRRRRSQAAGRKPQSERAFEQTAAEPASARGATRARTPRVLPESRLPSPTARITGFAIALITAFLGVVVIKDAVAHMSGAGAAIQTFGGLLLLLLAVAVGALVLVPGRVRELFRRS